MEGGISEALPVVFAKELAVHHADVIHFIARATAVNSLPLFWRHLPFSRISEKSHCWIILQKDQISMFLLGLNYTKYYITNGSGDLKWAVRSTGSDV